MAKLWHGIVQQIGLIISRPVIAAGQTARNVCFYSVASLINVVIQADPLSSSQIAAFWWPSLVPLSTLQVISTMESNGHACICPTLFYLYLNNDQCSCLLPEHQFDSIQCKRPTTEHRPHYPDATDTTYYLGVRPYPEIWEPPGQIAEYISTILCAHQLTFLLVELLEISAIKVVSSDTSWLSTTVSMTC